jgi:ABC-2 type transport system permease protein
MLVTGYGFHAEALVLYPMALIALLVFTTAVALWASAVNVRYRDVGHLIGLALLVWFWATPIVYPGGLVQEKLAGETLAGLDLWNLYLLNPLTDIVLGFQRALYGIVGPQALPDVSVAWIAGLLATVIGASSVLLLLSWRLFFRRSGDFAEEL